MTSTDHFFVDAKVSLFGRRFNNANMLPLRGIKKRITGCRYVKKNWKFVATDQAPV
jgi:hypothetical protein